MSEGAEVVVVVEAVVVLDSGGGDSISLSGRM